MMPLHQNMYKLFKIMCYNNNNIIIIIIVL